MRILLLNGPNLGRLGLRQPEIYGSTTLAQVTEAVRERAAARGSSVDALQTNHEGGLIDRLEQRDYDGVVINPGAFTHYAWSLHDALAAFDGPVVEVHISNPNTREPWRHTSVVAPVATGSIMGFGMHGYELAVDAVARRLAS